MSFRFLHKSTNESQTSGFGEKLVRGLGVWELEVGECFQAIEAVGVRVGINLLKVTVEHREAIRGVARVVDEHRVVFRWYLVEELGTEVKALFEGRGRGCCPVGDDVEIRVEFKRLDLFEVEFQRFVGAVP